MQGFGAAQSSKVAGPGLRVLVGEVALAGRWHLGGCSRGKETGPWPSNTSNVSGAQVLGNWLGRYA